ncbi:extracellular solute-binding protein [Aureibacillus halotolerans]|uniref:Extracellular solute-binding protein n=1 Tax=Aureibacillus halotolerans TaxID=1508390 RepID=A0A4R6TWN8_9BACI|nr:extracellular solute-binding protein [Aureibacillus halotolerans]TDQ36429.1 extracellular solute-binding protein [Aureibacillus halotolerans]
MRRKRLHLIIACLTIFILASCVSEDTSSEVVVQIHEMMPTEATEQVQSFLEESAAAEGAEDTNIEVQVFPFNAQKITVEIGANRVVDVIIANEDYLSNLLNQGGLVSLDDLYEGEEPPEGWAPYVREDPETNESHLFGVPLTKDSAVFKELGLTPGNPLLAIIPQFTNHPEDAKMLLKAMAEPVE